MATGGVERGDPYKIQGVRVGSGWGTVGGPKGRRQNPGRDFQVKFLLPPKNGLKGVKGSFGIFGCQNY